MVHGDSSVSVRSVTDTYISRNANNKSLAIIDELGRGTSTRDGLAIAIAIAEALVLSNAMVFFATHFTEIGRHPSPPIRLLGGY